MRYVIQRFAGGFQQDHYTRRKRDAAALLFERTVRKQIAALGGLDTQWGNSAMRATAGAWINDVDVLTVRVGPDHKVTFQRFTT